MTTHKAQYRNEQARQTAHDDATALFVALDDCRTLLSILRTNGSFDHDSKAKAARESFVWPHVESYLSELQRVAKALREEAENGSIAS